MHLHMFVSGVIFLPRMYLETNCADRPVLGCQADFEGEEGVASYRRRSLSCFLRDHQVCWHTNCQDCCEICMNLPLLDLRILSPLCCLLHHLSFPHPLQLLVGILIQFHIDLLGSAWLLMSKNALFHLKFAIWKHFLFQGFSQREHNG